VSIDVEDVLGGDRTRYLGIGYEVIPEPLAAAAILVVGALSFASRCRRFSESAGCVLG
jgi:hypothetical protein